MPPILPALYGASVLLVNSTIWIFGGNADMKANGSYTIDVSKSWNISSPPLTTFPSSDQFFSPRYFSSLALGADQSSLWFYGGASRSLDLTTANQFAVFDTHANAWSNKSTGVITTQDINPPPVMAHSAVRDLKGVVYYYGGSGDLTSTDLSDFANGPGLMKLDTRTANFSSVPLTPGSPTPLAWHTSTLVNDTLMYVIGGLKPNPDDDFTVTVYNIATNSWSSPVNSTIHPPTRHGHTATLSNDNSQIIVYGGINSNVTMNDVWTLNLATNQWTQRNTTGPAPPARAFHNSVMVKNQMIVMFGIPQSAVNTPYVLDTNTWTWLTFFGSSPNPPTTGTSGNTDSSNTSDSSVATSSDSSDYFTPGVFSNTPITAAGIAGIVLAGIAVISIVMVSIVQPRNRVKPIM